MSTEEGFLKDVEKHELTIIRDEGLNRHLRFSKGSSDMRFDLITWPGHLCFTGDMGTYVFERLADMFEFFRHDREYAKKRGKQLAINASYWSEKLIAVACNGGRSKGGAMEFSKERFTEVINEYRVEWMRNSRLALTKEQRRELWEAVQDEVLNHIDDADLVQRNAYEFNWSAGRFLPGTYPSYQFDDLFDHRFDDYTFHFLWCCYALAWGIEKYDEAKEQTP